MYFHPPRPLCDVHHITFCMPWCCTQVSFTRFGAEKDLSNVAFAEGKNKSRPKTFQTPEKCNTLTLRD